MNFGAVTTALHPGIEMDSSSTLTVSITPPIISQSSDRLEVSLHKPATELIMGDTVNLVDKNTSLMPYTVNCVSPIKEFSLNFASSDMQPSLAATHLVEDQLQHGGLQNTDQVHPLDVLPLPESPLRGFDMNFASDTVIVASPDPQIEHDTQHNTMQHREQSPRAHNLTHEGEQMARNTNPAEGESSQNRNPMTEEPVDVFLQSISNPIDQPLLPEPQPVAIVPRHSMEEHLDTQRRSVCLAQKAQSRVGKHTLTIAQDLHTKKLGELAEPATATNKPNFESFSQHLDHPLNKTEMEAIQDLVDHGTKMGGKRSTAKLLGAATKIAMT